MLLTYTSRCNSSKAAWSESDTASFSLAPITHFSEPSSQVVHSKRQTQSDVKPTVPSTGGEPAQVRGRVRGEQRDRRSQDRRGWARVCVQAWVSGAGRSAIRAAAYA